MLVVRDMKDIVALASPAQKATDAVFGSYAIGNAIAADKLKDRWADEEQRIAKLEKERTAGGKQGARAEAEYQTILAWRVQKIVNESAAVRLINEEHHAIGSRAQEAAYIEQIRNEVVDARAHDLLEIQKGWPGGAKEKANTIQLQMFKSTNADENRAFMWTQFQTMIHEYIHTLNHIRYVEYVKHLKDPAKSHALREGMTDYLTQVVWSTVNTSDPALRAAVEGPFHEPDASAPVPPLESYDAATEAEELVGLVGARNAYAAYFLGHVELIGG